MFQCDLRSKASNSTPLRHQPAKIEIDHNEYAIDYILDAKVDNYWPNRRGLYLQFLTHFVGYNGPEWMLLEQVGDCEQLSVFSHRMFGLNSPKHKLMFNSKLDVMLEMLTYTNDMLLILV